jgi:hypothetical protein
MSHTKGYLGERQQQGRGSTGKKLPICQNCNNHYLITLYAQETVGGYLNRRWIKKGLYCNWCGHFEAVVEPMRNNIV